MAQNFKPRRFSIAKKNVIFIFNFFAMTEQMLKQLNPVQYEAVTTTEGPLLVIAGAGSGKTRVLTCRVAHILSERLARPHNILAVTFTNKAANEMKERINTLLGTEIFQLTVATFHSFCARLLRKEAAAIGYPSNFTIFDEEDSLSLIKNCMDELNLSRNQFPPPAQRRKISTAKNNLLDADEFAEKAGGYFETRTAEIYSLYERRLRECGAFDFDDLIFQTVKLLILNEEIRKKYQERFKYILVDEYQDTNHSQYRLLKLLVGEHRNICVVGDEDQSIYGWRGADISNILNFEKDFPGARVIKLEQNYRSTNVILEAASTVIANNISRKGKTLWTETESGDKLQLFMTDNASEEASVIIDCITENLKRYPLKEMVILYRTNAQSRTFEEALRRRNMPYQIVGGVSFYQRKEIKDVMAYLKLIANPNDDVSFRRIVNYPRRGIGQTTLEKLAQSARRAGKSMYQVCHEIDKFEELSGRPANLIKKFVTLVDLYMRKKENLDIGELTEQLIDELKLPELLIAEDPLVGKNRAENIEEFIVAANEFASQYAEPTLDNFLTEISLYTDLDQYSEIDDKLTLMTLHSAKGLEFDLVCMVGLEEGLFPLARTFDNPMELEEERRLFYVGATRARKNLLLSMASVRNRFGYAESIPSRFLKELPPALVEMVDYRTYRSDSESTLSLESGSSERLPEKTDRYYEYEGGEIMSIGRIVQHPTFGRGKIVKVEGSGESLLLEIFFTGLGTKKIMAKYAKLKIVG